MSLNNTPASDRIHIGVFGKTNSGKSSLVNAITGQNLSIVSDIEGTTTDPVYKAMELLPLGPVVVIDTPGLNDEGALGSLRVKKSYQILNKTDIALLVIDAAVGKTDEDIDLINAFTKRNLPYIIAYNKSELTTIPDTAAPGEMWVSAATGYHIIELKEALTKLMPAEDLRPGIAADIISPSDFVILVVPIDKAAPKGRLILPQQQTIRAILEANATAIVVKESELRETLKQLGKKPAIVITDSQVFKQVSEDIPSDIMLTSFSILFARYKGNLELAARGAKTLELLQDGDAVLIAEGCTHHRQCDDIGTVKLPNWITQYTDKQINFEFCSGTEFPEVLTNYKLIVHCGGCMLNEREMKYRINETNSQAIPITNYGVLIAYMHGILKRSIEPFPNIAKILED